MFTFKSKKIFDKISKMDRKQAYTVGAIAVVSIIALLMLFSSVGGDDENFEGMSPRGYDLANMPFATDEAEQYLLAAKYPDMKENGSTLLYSAEEKKERQEQDEQAAQEAAEEASNYESSYDSNGNSSRDGSYRGGGYGGARGGGSGRGKTEIGQLGSATPTKASGAGVNATWGPSGDFRQFKGKENRGDSASTQFQTRDDARRDLQRSRFGSMAAARIKENKLPNAQKAMMGGYIQGSGAFDENGNVKDLSKIGGLTLDTDAPPTSTDLGNLDKAVADAAKDAKPVKPDPDKDEDSFWDKLLQRFAERAIDYGVDQLFGGIDSLISGNKAARAAGKEAAAGLSFLDLSDADKTALGYHYDGGAWLTADNKPADSDFARMATNIKYSRLKTSNASIIGARTEGRSKGQETSSESRRTWQIGQRDSNGCPSGKKLVSIKDKDGKDTGNFTCQ